MEKFHYNANGEDIIYLYHRTNKMIEGIVIEKRKVERITQPPIKHNLIKRLLMLLIKK